MSTTNQDAHDLASAAFGGLIHEDVMDKLWMINKIPLPFQDRVGTDIPMSDKTKHWTKDELAAPSLANALVDGADAPADSSAEGDRVNNKAQICGKTVKVSSRARRVRTIAFQDALTHQVMMRQEENYRDREAICLHNQASVNGTDSVAGKSGGFPAWVETNADGAGARGGFNTSTGVVDAFTVGTRRALTEVMFRDTSQDVFVSNGNVSVAMSIPDMIRRISDYYFTADAKVATLQRETRGEEREGATAIGAVTYIRLDHGVWLELVSNRLQQSYSATGGNACDLHLIDTERVGIAQLQPMIGEPMGRKGLYYETLIHTDWTLVVGNEKAHGVITELNYETAMTAS